MRRPPLPTISDLLRMYQLSTRKQLSQNFILDLNVTARLAKHALAGHVCATTGVVEVGPGPGSLTRSVLDTDVAGVVAVEKDTRFKGALAALAEADRRLEVVWGDMLRVDAGVLEAALPPHIESVALVGNLPFNVATPLVVGWLADVAAGRGLWADRSRLVTMGLMFQKEVAHRLVAECGDSAYSRLSIMAAMYTTPVLTHIIPASVFVPAPKVDAAMVVLTPRTDLATAPPFSALETVTRTAFGAKRKVLRNALKSLPAAAAAADALGLSSARPADLPLDAWAAIAFAWARHDPL